MSPDFHFLRLDQFTTIVNLKAVSSYVSVIWYIDLIFILYGYVVFMWHYKEKKNTNVTHMSMAVRLKEKSNNTKKYGPTWSTSGRRDIEEGEEEIESRPCRFHWFFFLIEILCTSSVQKENLAHPILRVSSRCHIKWNRCPLSKLPQEGKRTGC